MEIKQLLLLVWAENVRILGRISDDTYGNELKINMQKNGIDISKLRIDSNEKSGVAFVWINEAGDNRIICSPAVNKKLSIEDIDNGLVDLKREIFYLLH